MLEKRSDKLLNVKNVFEKIYLLAFVIFLLAASKMKINYRIDLAFQFYINIFLIISFILTIKKLQYKYIKNNKILFIFSFWCLLSTIWSENKVSTLKNSIYVFLVIFLAIYIISKFSVDRILKIIFYYFSILTFMNLYSVIFMKNISIFLDPRYSLSYKGLFSHRTGFAAMMLFSFAFCLTYLNKSKHRLTCIIIFILNLYMMNLAKSSTAIAIAIYVILFYIIYMVFNNRILNLIFILTPFGVSIVLLTDLLNKFAEIITLLGREITLTGRTQIWFLVENAIKKRPFIGYGFLGAWQSNDFSIMHFDSILGFSATHSHNGFLEIILNIGVIGLVLYLITAFDIIRYPLKVNTDKKLAGIIIICICTLWLNNSTEVNMIYPTDIIFIIYILFYNIIKEYINVKDIC